MLLMNPALADDPAMIPLPTAVSESDFRPFSPQRARLGQLLFYDKLLSGNRNIACATCHHHGLASADGLSLGLGEGGVGLGVKRTPGEGESAVTRRIQRNAPALFNLGATEFQMLFHDGRLSVDADNEFHKGFNSPALEFLPEGLQSVLAAQAVFPLISEPEMAGHVDENEIAGARNRRFDYAWALVAKRVQGVAVYAQQFMAAFDDIAQGGDIKIHHIANALDDFMNAEWRTLNSPFDAYLRGDESALNTGQLRGMKLFYGKAQCATCHAGQLQTDHQFHSIALPQFGPGRTRQFDFKARDRGRINESDRPEDAYRFRTPSLRNVTATAPYGHNGAYKDLRGIVEHHLDPLGALERWTPEQLILPKFDAVENQDFLIQWDKQEQQQIRASAAIQKIALAASEVDAVLAFLGALTDEYALEGRLGEPDREKFSGLLLEDSIAQ
ncbi:MAG: Methylamine utilization protein mauG precursor [uncultured Thiotrichaceae bacterium]|uniref:Methylamine utilization protein mauG n=1 Tax=uncultured Thiotrichaceae bacterium TaxID=298394 RepID=A0A6S6U0P3_9GAMM|nr:MAG: Methylamine utilization protein mauG precursor [uncultured Thiotrichaceae bacterium]